MIYPQITSDTGRLLPVPLTYEHIVRQEAYRLGIGHLTVSTVGFIQWKQAGVIQSRCGVLGPSCR